MPDTPAHWKAVIDAEGKLLGFDKSGAGDGIKVPVNCDLVIGKYRYDHGRECWEPIAREFPRELPKGREPDHLIAIALGFRRIGKTIDLPAYTKEWVKRFDRFPDDVEDDGGDN